MQIEKINHVSLDISVSIKNVSVLTHVAMVYARYEFTFIHTFIIGRYFSI